VHRPCPCEGRGPSSPPAPISSISGSEPVDGNRGGQRRTHTPPRPRGRVPRGPPGRSRAARRARDVTCDRALVVACRRLRRVAEPRRSARSRCGARPGAAVCGATVPRLRPAVRSTPGCRRRPDVVEADVGELGVVVREPAACASCAILRTSAPWISEGSARAAPAHRRRRRTCRRRSRRASRRPSRVRVDGDHHSLRQRRAIGGGQDPAGRGRSRHRARARSPSEVVPGDVLVDRRGDVAGRSGRREAPVLPSLPLERRRGDAPALVQRRPQAIRPRARPVSPSARQLDVRVTRSRR